MSLIDISSGVNEQIANDEKEIPIEMSSGGKKSGSAEIFISNTTSQQTRNYL